MSREFKTAANHEIFQSGNFNINSYRPYLNDRGEPCVVNNVGEEVRITTNASLRHEEWKRIDDTVILSAVDRLTGINLLRSKGLIHPLGSIGITISQWEEQSNITPANVSMSGITRGEEDKASYDLVGVPIPVIHKDFRVNWRTLEASRTRGESIDVSMSAMAGRVVAEASEDLLFTTSSISADGNSLSSLFNFANRVQVVGGTPWDDLAADGNEVILEIVNDMLSALGAVKFHGPFEILIPAAYEAKMEEDYRANDNRTVRQRLEALSKVGRITVADRISGDNVSFVQMTPDVIDLAVGQDMTTLQWETLGGRVNNFTVLAAWAPRLKNDYDGNSGIGHLTFSS